MTKEINMINAGMIGYQDDSDSDSEKNNSEKEEKDGKN
jgi:hypothetical protein